MQTVTEWKNNKTGVAPVSSGVQSVSQWMVSRPSSIQPVQPIETPKVGFWDVIKGIPQAAVNLYKPLVEKVVQPFLTPTQNILQKGQEFVNALTEPSSMTEKIKAGVSLVIAGTSIPFTPFIAPFEAASKVPVLKDITGGIDEIFKCAGVAVNFFPDKFIDAIPNSVLEEKDRENVKSTFNEITNTAVQIWLGAKVIDGITKGIKITPEKITELKTEALKIPETIPETKLPEIKSEIKPMSVSEWKDAGKPTAPEPKPVSAISKELEPLAQEARKYKSAEEFVRSQKPLFRGGGVEGMGTGVGRLGSGTYVSTDKGMADAFAVMNKGTTQEFYPKPDLRILSADSKEFIKIKESVGLNYWENPPTKTAADIITEKVKKLGYNGVESLDKATGIVIFDKNNLLTKSQLTDFYTQATKGIGEVKPEITIPPKPIETTSTEQLTSRVFERIQAEHPQVEGELGYDPIKLKADAQKAVDLIATDKQKAYDIAMGKETSPDITSTAVNIAMSEKALGEGNIDLYSRLVRNRSLEQTRRGQEIVAERGSITDNSTSKYVKELIAARLEALGKKYLSGLKEIVKKTDKGKATDIINKEVAKVEEKIRTKKLDVKSALDLLELLTCL
jgi:hypothetical protein